ncbi:histidine kinase [Paenibacillus sp. 2TAB26]|uniref:sensor histidine kinase n=1 Tax=Paenibacillus sp. 2TAB26 TaxID=3233005 RepID=UPI003F9BDAAB
MVVLTYATIQQSTRTIQHNSYKYINLALDQTGSNLNRFLQLAHDTTNNAVGNKLLQKALIDAKRTGSVNPLKFSSIRDSLNVAFVDTNVISYMELHSLQNETVASGICFQTITTDTLKLGAEALDGASYWSVTETPLCQASTPFTLSGTREVMNLQRPNEVLGYLTYTIDSKDIIDILQSGNESQLTSMILVSDSGEAIINHLHEKNREQIKTLFASQPTLPDILRQHSGYLDHGYLFTSYEVPNTRWLLVAITPQSELTRGLGKVYYTSLWVGALLILATIVFSTLFASFLTRPIRNIISKMKLVAFGNFKVKVEQQRFFNQESEQLAQNFTYMVENFRYLVQEVYEKQDLERKATLRALQAQVNPHFLYNTLDNIFWGLESEGKSKTSQVILDLSQMLRYALNPNTSMTTLDEELSHIKRYISIIQYRYPGRFHTYFNVPKELLDCTIPRLLIQPLIENAITYGIEPKKSAKELRIDALLSQDNVTIVISDDGAGIPEEKLRSLLKKKRITHDRQTEKGLGLLNVHDRLRLHYGEAYGAEIKSELGVGTKITITFPCTILKGANANERC